MSTPPHSPALDSPQPPPLPDDLPPYEPMRTLRYGFRIGTLGLLVAPHTPSEVVEPEALYPLPNTPPWLLGLLNLRGTIVPVFHLQSAIGLEATPTLSGKTRVLVLDRDERAAGLVVDGFPRSLTLDNPSLAGGQAKGLEAFVGQAYDEVGTIWLEFDHRAFFNALRGRFTP
ncbi:MAG: chemotaxis protein CheW [Candidatus Competibacterales bacterium]